MTQQRKRRAPGASGSAARYIQDTDGSECTACFSPSQVRFDRWLDRPTCRDRQREIDGALLAAKFATVPVDRWRAAGGEL